MAYQQLYTIFGAGCNGCDFQHDFGIVNINNQTISEYMGDKQANVNFIEIEPLTGTMTKMRRSYTMVLSLNCYDRSSICNCTNDSQKPFPSLKTYKHQKIPIFSVDEGIEIDKLAFEDSVSYITKKHVRIWLWSLGLAFIAIISLCLACCFQCIYWMNEPVKQEVDARVLRAVAAEHEDEVVDENEQQPIFIF